MNYNGIDLYEVYDKDGMLSAVSDMTTGETIVLVGTAFKFTAGKDINSRIILASGKESNRTRKAALLTRIRATPKKIWETN